MRKAGWLWCGLFVASLTARGQEMVRPEPDLALLVQELLSEQEPENLSFDDLYETLMQRFQVPLDLNRAGAEELSSLWVLTPFQINNLLQYLQTQGPLQSLYELQVIPGWDLATIHRLLPFVTLREPSNLRGRDLLQQVRQQGQHQLLLRYERVLEQRQGYTAPDTVGQRLTARYAGSPDKYLVRYRSTYNQHYSFGFVLEKDAGEAFRWYPARHQYGPDFHSFHAQVYNRGRWKTLALGDYQLQFGQGLLLSAGFFVGKGGETITTIRRSHLGIRPFHSVLEAAFLRGLAATYALSPRLNLTGFISYKKLDATIADSGLNEGEISFSSLQASGLHRTASELANKHRVAEFLSGTDLSYRNQAFRGGITLIQSQFDLPAQAGPQPYRLYGFRGHQYHGGSMNFEYTWQNLHFFGETALSKGGGWGSVNGILVNLARNVEASVLYRNYGTKFQTFYGQAFGERTENRNERGWYTGLKLRPARHLELTAYYDHFRFPWLRYRVDGPSSGQEYLCRLLYKPSRHLQFYLQARGERKELNLREAGRNLPALAVAQRAQYLAYLHYDPVAAFRWRSRVQVSRFEHGGRPEKGYFLGQELQWRRRNMALTAAYALFETDSYDARIYVPESDVLYAVAVPAWSGVGTRVYVLWQQQVFDRLDLWFKLAQTHYRYQESIGSGLEKINQPHKTDVRVQVRYRL